MSKVVFVTGTRADYGKIKALIRAMCQSGRFSVYIYITGMHLLKEYGSTYRQVIADGWGECYVEQSVDLGMNMDGNFAKVTLAFSNYIHRIVPDFVVVHGDRIDAMAGAIVGMLNNIRVVHIEGGELTGTVDDSIRHAITKLAHIHMTANEETRSRLMQLGEKDANIHIIGSPDIDIMLSDTLPAYEDVRERNGIFFGQYAIFIYHAVVTETERLEQYMQEIDKAIEDSGRNYVVVYPNNDTGSDIITRHLDVLRGENFIKAFRSIPFEDFLVLLRHADFIMGNSSAGIREACIYGIPCINIGSRQMGRYSPRILKNIITVKEDRGEILQAIREVDKHRFVSHYYGDGNSTELFIHAMMEEDKVSGNADSSVQKEFVDSKETRRRIEQFINEGCG